MSLESDLKKEGIEAIKPIDKLISNSIAQNVSRRIIETFPNYDFTTDEIYNKLSHLNMYRAKMTERMAEASYYYKNTSIYFNEQIDTEDLEEFAIHECIHYLQERKDSQNNLIRMGLCTYKKGKPTALGLNEAAVQFISSHIIGIEPNFEKYYNITLYTPSPSYYPLECSLLNEILYFTGTDILFKSTLFSNDDFKNLIIKKTSESTYGKIISSFDFLIKLEENLIKQNNKTASLENGDSRIESFNSKSNKLKHKILNTYISTQNLIIKEFFENEFNKISNLEELENFRHKIYKFSDIIGTIEQYKFFDLFYVEMMNKLEHKCNILENGKTETAIAKTTHNFIFEFFKRLFKLGKDKTEETN